MSGMTPDQALIREFLTVMEERRSGNISNQQAIQQLVPLEMQAADLLYPMGAHNADFPAAAVEQQAAEDRVPPFETALLGKMDALTAELKRLNKDNYERWMRRTH